MVTFGHIKNKVLTKLSNSYGKSEFKSNLKNHFKPIMENDTVKEMYSLYEELETKTFDDKDTAVLYVEELSNVLKEKYNDISETLIKMNESLSDVDSKNDKLYECIDSLSSPDKLGNISDKVISKKYLVEHLLTNKTNKTLVVKNGVNENLLNSVLVNNFNLSYDKTLSEEDRSKLKEILSLDQESLEEKTKTIHESINGRLDDLVNEDPSFSEKSNLVREEIQSMEISKFNLYRLEDLLDELK